MQIHDISMTIRPDMPVYHNDSRKSPVIETMRDYITSNGMESRIRLEMHTGTHLDMPLHFLQAGQSLDALAMDRVIRPCKVFDLTRIADRITRQDLEALAILPDDFILLKTRNSAIDTFDNGFVFVEGDAARYLCELGISGVGIDSLGIERDQSDHATHKALFGAGIVIIEGLRLQDVSPGEYFLVAAPLKIQGVEASPLRALLLTF